MSLCRFWSVLRVIVSYEMCAHHRKKLPLPLVLQLGNLSLAQCFADKLHKIPQPDALQIHCSAPLPALNAFPIWKHRNAAGKWDRILKFSCQAWACSVGWSPSPVWGSSELCLTGFISQDTHWWLHPWNSWISPPKHLWKSDLWKWVGKGCFECWLVCPFCFIQQHLAPIFDTRFVILNVPAFSECC